MGYEMNHISGIDERMLPAIRWDILRTIHTGQRHGATDKIVYNTLAPDYLSVTMDFVRNQMVYLETRELVSIRRSEDEPWRGHLTRIGWDLVEYRIPCEAGIRRPPRPGAAMPD